MAKPGALHVFSAERNAVPSEVLESIITGTYNRDLTEDEARGSFDILQRYGMLRIDEGGAFTPTQQYLEYFDGQLAPEETTT